MPLPFDPNDPNAQPPPGAPPPGGAPPEEAMPEEAMPPDGVPPEEGPDAGIPPSVSDQEEGVTQATPEEQEQKDHFVKKAWELIYSDEMWPQILQMLEGGGDDTQEGDPVQGLATATEMVVARVGQAAEQAGETLQPDIVYHAGADILEELADVSAIGKIKDYSKDPDALEKAWFVALDMFRERLAGVDEIDQEGAKADLDRLSQMDQNGTLDKIMRDLAASDQSGEAGGPGGPNAPQGFKPKGLGVAAEAKTPARPPARQGAM
jgi:hypothetical protein